jgi:hypothetical protein
MMRLRRRQDEDDGDDVESDLDNNPNPTTSNRRVGRRRVSQRLNDNNATLTETDSQPIVLRNLSERSTGSKALEKSALNHFKAFLEREGKPPISSDPAFRAILTTELFGKFGNYLQVVPKLRRETALSYMSAIKTYVIVELNSTIFQSDSGQWYRNLRSTMEKEYVNQSIQTGEEIQTRAEAMSVVELAEICRAIFRLKNYKDRALLCIQYHCFGRISEVVAVNLSCLK